MEQKQQQLQHYIRQQLVLGQTPDAIALQLSAAGWQHADISQAFSSIQASVVPTSSTADPTLISNAHAQSSPGFAEGTRGRLRTGWQLLKTCWTILRGNPYLLRYFMMTAIWIVAITAAIIALIIMQWEVIYTSNDTNNDTLSPLGLVLAFINYLLVYFIATLYAAGLTANMFDIFKGVRQPYNVYMQQAWSRFPQIFWLSLINSIIGMILKFIVERIRFIGKIVSLLIGASWSLATMFTIPIIMQDKDCNAPTAIKKSFSLFKQTWGEGITVKASIALPMFLILTSIYLAIGPVLFFVGITFQNYAASVLAIAFMLILLLVAQAFGTFANNVVNTALYYYATERQAPPAFSEELLNRVFIKRKKRFTWLRRE